MKKLLLILGFGGAAVVAGANLLPLTASSHREAPLISQDPLVDNTDLYAFISPTTQDKVTIIANFIPLEAPYGGPNFYKFDDNALYEIKIDNNGDAREDVTFQFKFKTTVMNPNTFLYNTGPITSLNDPDFNVRQTYTVTRALGHTGNRNSVLGSDLPTPPVNIGIRSTPDYDVHTIAIEVPIAMLSSTGVAPASASAPNAVIGIWSTASRPSTTVRRDGSAKSQGTTIQVSRLGNPLVNEVVIPRAAKDIFNGLEPTDDAAALQYVLDPEVPKLLNAVFGIQSPPAPRNDLVTIFLTGIPGLNQPPGVRPAELLRLNMAIPPAAQPNTFGVLGNDIAGFPNGRRLTDDVVDIAVRAMAGATPLTPSFNQGINTQLGDGVSGNDKPFLLVFPYLATPHAGNKQ